MTGRIVQEQDVDAALERLEKIFVDLGSCGVAFSAGIDSTLVLKVAFDTLGPNAIAFVGVSDSLLQEERDDALDLADEIGVALEWVETHEIDQPGYRQNSAERCYFCKQELHTKLIERIRVKGLAYVVDGLHLGDAGDHRPGVRAADEKGVRHPLIEAGFDKPLIRRAANRLGLSNWDKPAMACLSSRVPFGTPVTQEVLQQIAAAESGLRGLGYRGYRVRHHGNLARLEMAPDDMDRAWSQRETLAKVIRDAGYTYVALDTGGYRRGSAHEVT